MYNSAPDNSFSHMSSRHLKLQLPTYHCRAAMIITGNHAPIHSVHASVPFVALQILAKKFIKFLVSTEERQNRKIQL